MLTSESLTTLRQTLRRIFSLKITRSTYREVQNAAVSATGGNKEAAQALFESLLRGEVSPEGVDPTVSSDLQSLVEEYAIPVALSRDISEKGEFINLVTSDTLRHGELFAFLNRVRRVDGEEFQFITDIDATLHLLLHFGSRLQELKGAENGQELLASKSQALTVIRNQIDALLATGPVG